MGILDKAIEALQKSSDRMEAKDMLLDFLKNAYVNEVVTLEQLKREASYNPYPHIRKELEEVVKSEEQHIQQIRGWIEEVNGKMPEITIPESELTAYSKIGDIIRKKLEVYDSYAEIMNILENNYLNEEYERLKEIKNQEKRHIDRLDDILTRVNA